jgi:hypothetical protein
MPDTSAVSALIREYGAQFTAGFFTTAVAVATIYAVFQPPVRAATAPQFDVIKRLSFASSLSGNLPLAQSTSLKVRSPIISDPANDRRYQRANTQPLLQAAAYEIAGRFAELTPVVSPILPAQPAEPVKTTSYEPQPEPATLARPAAPAEIQTATLKPGEADDEVPVRATILPPRAWEPGNKREANQPLEESLQSRPPSVRLTLTRSPTSTTRIAFPLDLNPSWPEKRDAGILVGGLPEGVTLSAGRRTALGLWKLLGADARTTQLVISPAAPAQFALTVLLLDPEGLVVNGIDLVVTLREAGPGITGKEASNLEAATSTRSSRRRGAAFASHRRKSQEARHIVQKAKRFHSRQTVTTLMKPNTASAGWTIQRHKVTAQN